MEFGDAQKARSGFGLDGPGKECSGGTSDVSLAAMMGKLRFGPEVEEGMMLAEVKVGC